MPDPAAYLLDLDGTLYASGAAIPGAVEAIDRLRTAGIPFRLVTNTTSRSRGMLVERLRHYGFMVGEPDILTATLAGAELARGEGLLRIAPFVPKPALTDLAGLELVGGTSGRPTAAAPGAPAAVIVGDLGDRWTYGLLQEAFDYVMAGARLIALSRDRYWLRDGRLALDAGPFVAALEYASGGTALVAGKPSQIFFRAGLRSLGATDPGSVAMVGDDLWSDVEGGQRAGLQGWLVRTGKFHEETLHSSGITPDRVLASVAELVRSP